MNSRPSRRRNYWIKKSFQSSLSARFVVLAVVEAFLITALFLFVSRGTLTTGYREGSQLLVERTAVFFFSTFALISLISVIAISLVGMIVFIVLSHRLAGPLYRIEKSLRVVADGDLTHRVRFREKDQLGELAVELNRLTKRWDEKMAEFKKEVDAAAKTIAGRDGKENLGDIKKTVDRLKEISNSFKTSP